jgi:DNA-binding LytR/AlgR family response regulator
MKIVIEEPGDGEEDQVIVRCRQMDPGLYQWIMNLKAQANPVIGYSGNEIHRIEPGAIYYFEAVDNKVFIYCRQRVYESKQRLYEIEAQFANSDFIRVSKSVILNIGKINSIAPAYGGRFEATLDNQEKVIISRQYVPALKEKLKV